jgi:hypothetical protein
VLGVVVIVRLVAPAETAVDGSRYRVRPRPTVDLGTPLSS